MKKFANLSFLYLILGLIGGVFYREFTKFNDFNGQTVLKSIHPHLLVLGFIFFIIVLILEKNFNISEYKRFNIWFISYNISLILVVITLILRGILQVMNKDFVGLSHMAGTTHTMLGICMIWFGIIIKNLNFNN
ncbi:DUF2871 domain-containing protein [Clostridium ihumii]|uniref:DUF2871 domain-containing protein n=1 Tax=Clostridium ihumii TaxID=1470356 RepID=UPI003D347E99